MARALMLQGTGSDVGKSMVVAGLCRAYAKRGLAVRPFKPQNMSNNAAVTADGGEIGRAQALQARACGVPAVVHMNPVLLKPQSEVGSQVVVQGRVVGNAKARAFQAMKPQLLGAVLDSFVRLKAEADLVLVEGAGSAAEVNLRTNDIANMGFARAANVPVVLIGDIDRGGVIAQIVGTQVVLDPADAALVVGFLVNKFRGDASLFDTGLTTIEAHTRWASLGLIPFFREADRLPAEDAMALAVPHRTAPGQDERIRVVVPVLPRIANFDDFDPLRLDPAVDLVMVRDKRPLPPADLIVLPGSKATIADLADLRALGWDIDILAHVRRGGRVLGICGGYQMLGRSIADPDGIEGDPGSCTGLGLLDVATVLRGDKQLRAVTGVDLTDREPFSGYEMHVGETVGPDCARPLLRFSDGSLDGAVSANGAVAACYVHGLFGEDAHTAGVAAQVGCARQHFLLRSNGGHGARQPRRASRTPRRPRSSAALCPLTGARQDGVVRVWERWAAAEARVWGAAMIITAEHEDLPVPGGGVMRIHVFRPAVPGRYPAVLFFSEIYQVTDPIRRLAAMLAGQGYVVGVPEVYHEYEAAGTVLRYDQAGTDRGNLLKYTKPVPAFDADAAAALGFLAQHPASTGRLATMGVCLGGHLALRAALDPSVLAAACFYPTDVHSASLGVGKADNSLTRLDELGAETLFVFGRQDPHVPFSGRATIRNRLEEVGARYEWHEVNAAHALSAGRGAAL